MIPIYEKTCKICDKTKPITEYRIVRNKYYYNFCRCCEKNEKKMWRQLNKDKVAQHNKRYQQKIKLMSETDNLISLATKMAYQPKEVNFLRPITDFVAECYLKLNTGSRGLHIEQKIIQDLRVKKLARKKLSGDFTHRKLNFEIKTSYLNIKNNQYTIVHIRPWHKIDYYIICFINCDDNFKQDYFVLPKHFIDNELGIDYMNGSIEDNKYNQRSEQRVTITKSSKKYFKMIDYNLLPDTSYESLVKFVKCGFELNKESFMYNYLPPQIELNFN